MRNSLDLICTSAGLLIRRVGLHEIIHVELLLDWCVGLWMFLFGHLHTSTEKKLHKNVSLWLQKWVVCTWRSFHCHPLSTINGDSPGPGFMAGCQSAWKVPRCPLWLPLSTVWSGEEGQEGCRVDPPLSNASLSEIPLYLEAAFVTLQILSGFFLLMTE